MSTYRIDHRFCDLILAQRVRNHRDRRRRCKHSLHHHQQLYLITFNSQSNTGLDNVDSDIVRASFDLLLYKRRRRLMDSINALGVLGSQSSRRSHGIAAMSGDHFLIGFEAPARFIVSAVFLLSSKRRVLRRVLPLTPRQSCPSQQSQECASSLEILGRSFVSITCICLC